MRKWKRNQALRLLFKKSVKERRIVNSSSVGGSFNLTATTHRGGHAQLFSIINICPTQCQCLWVGWVQDQSSNQREFILSTTLFHNLNSPGASFSYIPYPSCLFFSRCSLIYPMRFSAVRVCYLFFEITRDNRQNEESAPPPFPCTHHIDVDIVEDDADDGDETTMRETTARGENRCEERRLGEERQGEMSQLGDYWWVGAFTSHEWYNFPVSYFQTIDYSLVRITIIIFHPIWTIQRDSRNLCVSRYSVWVYPTDSSRM